MTITDGRPSACSTTHNNTAARRMPGASGTSLCGYSLSRAFASTRKSSTFSGTRGPVVEPIPVDTAPPVPVTVHLPPLPPISPVDDAERPNRTHEFRRTRREGAGFLAHAVPSAGTLQGIVGCSVPGDRARPFPGFHAAGRHDRFRRRRTAATAATTGDTCPFASALALWGWTRFGAGRTTLCSRSGGRAGGVGNSTGDQLCDSRHESAWAAGHQVG